MALEDALTLRQLRALSAVARLGTMAAAGRDLGLTTPAIHSQIKGLEELFGLPLLYRPGDGAGQGATPAGEALLDAIHKMDVALSQAGARIAALKAGHAGRVSLGVVSTAKYFAPRLVKLLRSRHPGIDIALHVGNREEILADIDRMRFDLIVMGRPPRMPPVEARPIGPHPHGLVAAPDHPLTGRSALSAADLAGETFLTREPGSGTRILMTRWLDRIGDGAPFTQVEMGSNETIKQAVMAGLGIAILSLHTVADELRHGTLVTLQAPGLPIERHWFLVRRLDQPPAPAAQALADTIIALQGGFLPKIPA